MDQHVDIGILRRSELFRGASEAVLGEAQALSFRQRIEAGSMLYRQGDEPGSIYVIVAGRLRASQTSAEGQQVILRHLSPGEMAGYASLTGANGHPATVTALEDAHLIGWTAAAFRQLMARHSSIAMNVLAVLGTRYQDMQTRLREVATERVERRIAHAILRLVQQAGRRTSRGIEIALPLSRQDIAEMTGTTLHSVSRALSAWESQGIVMSGRRRVTVCKAHSLTLIAEDVE